MTTGDKWFDMLMKCNDEKVKLGKEIVDLSEKIIDASLYWTGSMEEKNPHLKTIRTLAGIYKEKYSFYKGEK